MVIRGVLFHPLQFENMFVSLVHDDRDIDDTLNAAADALTVVARTRNPPSDRDGTAAGRRRRRPRHVGDKGGRPRRGRRRAWRRAPRVPDRQARTGCSRTGSAATGSRRWRRRWTDLARDGAHRVVGGMGLSAMLPTLVECDEHGGRSSPGHHVGGRQGRAGRRALRAAVGDDALYRITGTTGRRSLPGADARADGRDSGARARRWRGRRTRCSHTSPASCSPTRAPPRAPVSTTSSANSWDAELVAAAADSARCHRLPAAATRPLAARRVVRATGGCPPGFPVVLGAADSVLGASGVGATGHGDVAVIAGTSAIVLGISDAPTRDGQGRYLVTPLTGVGWGLEMDLLAVGSAFEGIAPSARVCPALKRCSSRRRRCAGRCADSSCRIWRRANRVRCGTRI